MIEAPSHVEPPEDSEDEHLPEEAGSAEGDEQLFDLIVGDLRASAILVAAKELVGGRIAADIMTTYLSAAREGFNTKVTENMPPLRDKGRGRIFPQVKAAYESALAQLEPEDRDQIREEARKYVTALVLEKRPSEVWTRIPEARLLVVLMLRHTTATPRIIAKALSLYMRDTLDLPLGGELPSPPFATEIAKRGKGEAGRTAYADKLAAADAKRGQPGLIEPQGEALEGRLHEISALIEKAKIGRGERSPVWEDDRARTVIATLLLDKNVSVDAISWAAQRFFGHDLPASTVGYRIYSHPGGREGLARMQLERAVPSLAPEVRRLVRGAKVGCYAYSIESAVARKMHKYDLDDPATAKRLRMYFIGALKRPHDVHSVMEAALAHGDELLSTLAVARSIDPTLKRVLSTPRGDAALTMQDVYDVAARRGLINLFLSRETCDVVFILNRMSTTGVKRLVLRGERGAARDRSLDAPLAQEQGAQTLADITGEADRGFEQFETRNEMAVLLERAKADGLLDQASVSALEKVARGEDLEDAEDYARLADAIRTVPELASLLGLEE